MKNYSTDKSFVKIKFVTAIFLATPIALILFFSSILFHQNSSQAFFEDGVKLAASVCSPANNTGANSADTADCGANQTCSATTMSCVNIDLCANKNCAANTTCQPANGACVPNGTAGTTVTPVAGSQTGSANSTDCGGNTSLVNVNGLCLPKNQFDKGIANSQSLSDFLLQLIQLLLDVVGAIAVLILVVGGFWYITSAGNEEQAEKGKTAIVNAIIGIIVVTLSYAIVTIIGSTLTK